MRRSCSGVGSVIGAFRAPTLARRCRSRSRPWRTHSGAPRRAPSRREAPPRGSSVQFAAWSVHGELDARGWRSPRAAPLAPQREPRGILPTTGVDRNRRLAARLAAGSSAVAVSDIAVKLAILRGEGPDGTSCQMANGKCQMCRRTGLPSVLVERVSNLRRAAHLTFAICHLT